MLARDPEIYNFFPDEKNNYDGGYFWKKHRANVCVLKYGHWLPEIYYKKLNKDKIISELNHKFDDRCKYGLLKRPQFILNVPFLQWLFPNVKLFGIIRKPIPTAYSYFRTNYTNNPHRKGLKVGQKPPNWMKFKDKSVMEYAAWCYRYSEAILEKYNIDTITYEELCDSTEKTIGKLERYIDKDLDINYDYIPNLNCVYKTGCQPESRNQETKTGKLNIGHWHKKKTVPPFTESQINELNKYLEKYEDLKVKV